MIFQTINCFLHVINFFVFISLVVMFFKRKTIVFIKFNVRRFNKINQFFQRINKINIIFNVFFLSTSFSKHNRNYTQIFDNQFLL